MTTNTSPDRTGWDLVDPPGSAEEPEWGQAGGRAEQSPRSSWTGDDARDAWVQEPPTSTDELPEVATAPMVVDSPAEDASSLREATAAPQIASPTVAASRTGLASSRSDAPLSPAGTPTPAAPHGRLTTEATDAEATQPEATAAESTTAEAQWTVVGAEPVPSSEHQSQEGSAIPAAPAPSEGQRSGYPSAASRSALSPSVAARGSRSAGQRGRAADAPATGTVGEALDLFLDPLKRPRLALLGGVITLVLSVWALVALPVALRFGIDAATADGGAATTVLIPAGALAALALVQAVLRALASLALGRVGDRAGTLLRGRLLEHIHRLEPGTDTAASTSVLIDDVAELRDLVARSGPRLAVSALGLASLLSLAVAVEPYAAALVLLTAGAMLLLTRWSWARRRRAETAAAREDFALAQVADELLAGTGTVQTLGLQDWARTRADELGARARRSRAAARRAGALDAILTWLITGLGTGAALLIGGWRLDAGTMTVGEQAMIITDVLIGLALARQLIRHRHALRTAREASGRISAQLDRRPDLSDPKRPQEVGRVDGDLVFSSLTDHGPHRPRFAAVSLRIPAGQQVALLSEDGKEASALVAYLLREDEPDIGRVLLDRLDTRTFTRADLRRQVAIVDREPVLFTQTVRENIRLGRLGASDEEVHEAARRSGAHELIAGLLDGYDTVLTRGGADLGTAGRRRIAIARALLRDAPVLVLDHADEGLLPQERESVVRALDVLRSGRTVLIRSAQPATIRSADRVLCFADGDLLEDDAPAALGEDADSHLSSWLRGTAGALEPTA